MALEHVKHWTVGKVEIVRIAEVYGFVDDVAVLLQGGTPELMKSHAWLQPHFATPDGRMILSFQCFALKVGDHRMMIDTCIGSDRQRPFDVFCNMPSTFLEDLASAGYTTDNIRTVLCTHLHFDHVGWNTRKVGDKFVPTFPNARYLFGREEWDHWKQHEGSDDPHHLHLGDAVRPVWEAGLVDLVENTHKICDEIWLEPTPGHTPGHVSVHISSEGEEAIITGDLLHHPIQLAEPDMKGNFDMQWERAAETRRKFAATYQDRKALIIGSHFAEPTSAGSSATRATGA